MLPDELGRFLEALKDDTPDHRDFFLLLLLTGARKGNVLSMRWEDIDLGDAVWRIPDTKTGDPQVLHLSKYAQQLLDQRRDKLKWPASSKGEQLDSYLLMNHDEPGKMTPSCANNKNSPTRTRLTVSENSNALHWVFPGPGKTGHFQDPKNAWKKPN